MKYTKTELHTHLLGMLTAESFIGLIKNYTDYIYWPIVPEGHERLVRVDDLIYDEEFLNCLRIKQGNTIDDYNRKFSDYYEIRTFLVKFLVTLDYLNCKYDDFSLSKLVDSDYDSSIGFSNLMKFADHQMKLKMENKLVCNAMQDVYSDYLNRCLNELIDNGVKYVEISFSNANIISLLNINKDLEDKIDVKFLLSTERNKNISSFFGSLRRLKKGLVNSRIIGFDIMGEERIIDYEKEEEQYNKACISKAKAKRTNSLKYKLEKLINTFCEIGNENSVLRIHSGETRESMGNTEWILEALKEIKEKYKKEDPSIKILPPPILRIGHGIRFNPNNKRYVKLLKEFDATIEINISSNIALGNIDSVDDLPLEYYIKNKIPLLLSTDGSGLYDTCIRNENLIASSILLENFGVIIKNEKDYVNRYK